MFSWDDPPYDWLKANGDGGTIPASPRGPSTTRSSFPRRDRIVRVTRSLLIRVRGDPGRGERRRISLEILGLKYPLQKGTLSPTTFPIAFPLHLPGKDAWVPSLIGNLMLRRTFTGPSEKTEVNLFSFTNHTSPRFSQSATASGSTSLRFPPIASVFAHRCNPCLRILKNNRFLEGKLARNLIPTVGCLRGTCHSNPVSELASSSPLPLHTPFTKLPYRGFCFDLLRTHSPPITLTMPGMM